MNWQPIETYPATGEFVVAFKNGSVIPVIRYKTGWMFYNGDPIYGQHTITHWMPFPEPPHDPE